MLNDDVADDDTSFSRECLFTLALSIEDLYNTHNNNIKKCTIR